jgi:hypothetical protein
MELFSSGLGDAGGYVIKIFLLLSLGAAISILCGWLFVQILLWIQE